jgi:PAS domain S-box-containing protein
MSIPTEPLGNISNETLKQRSAELIQANRRLTLLTHVANSFILAEAPHESLQSAFNAVAGEIGARFYFNYELDSDASRTLTLKSSGGLGDAEESVFRRVPVGSSLCGLVAESREPVIAGDIQLRDDEMAASLKRLGVTAYVGLPLLAHRSFFGTLAFATISVAGFTEPDIALVKTLTDQCAAVLERGRLVETLRESEARYRVALSAGRVGTWETDFTKGTRLWSEEGMALFGLKLADARGHVGGDGDEYVRALHPNDRHLVQHFRDLADEQDSFPAEYRVVRPDGSILWLSGAGHVTARGLDGKAHRLVSVMVDITERKKAEDHIQFLLREMSHRSKNLLSVIQAIASQTARSSGTTEEFARRFIQRLHGLATSHDILVDQSWQGAPLADLVRHHLAPFVAGDPSRLVFSGPSVMVTAQAAQAVGLALNELATNAAMYGSLSTTEGRVVVRWDFENGDRAGRLRLTWSEEGGPPVSNPSSKGFGHVVIERIVADALDGDVAIDYAPQGLIWSISMRAATVLPRAPAS